MNIKAELLLLEDAIKLRLHCLKNLPPLNWDSIPLQSEIEVLKLAKKELLTTGKNHFF